MNGLIFNIVIGIIYLVGMLWYAKQLGKRSKDPKFVALQEESRYVTGCMVILVLILWPIALIAGIVMEAYKSGAKGD